MADAHALKVVAPLAAQQHGCWSRRQASDLGVSRRTLDELLRRGLVRSVLPGVLAAASTPAAWQMHAQAALLWASGDAVLARWTAARVDGLRVPERPPEHDPVHLLVGHRVLAPPDWVVVHRSRRIHADDLAQDQALRRTGVERTICDLAAELGPRSIRSLVAHAVRTGRTDAQRLGAALGRRPRFTGRPRLRALVQELSPLDADCASELEHRFLQLVRGAGLEPTAMNHPVRDVDGRSRRIDAVWLDEQVAVELDSRQEHGTLLDWNDDLRRESAIVLAGDWRAVLRFSWDDVTRHGPQVVDRLRTALGIRLDGVGRDDPRQP